MGNIQKFVTILLWSVLVLVMVGIVGAGLYDWRHTRTVQRLPTYYDAPRFALVDENNRPFSDADLRGKVWICDLIFTRCAGPCGPMTQNMSRLQKLVPNPRVHFVSFTVDPDNDTPAVLKGYAAKFGADLGRWSFLTGDKNIIYATARGLNLGAGPAQAGSATQRAEPPSHDTHFLLIDGNGHVRGIFDMAGGESLHKIADQTNSLLSETPE